MIYPNDFIKQIYIINLDHRIDRWTHIKNQLYNSQTILKSYQKYAGIDGNTIDNETIKKLINPNQYDYIINRKPTHGLNLSYGAIGLALTYKHIFENCDSNTLLLEDDINIDYNFDTIISNVINHMPNDWDIIYLGWYSGSTTRIEKINEHVGKITGQVNGTQGWIINQKSAKKLLNLFPLTYQIDTEIYLSDKLVKYCSLIPIITRYHSKSDIQIN